MISQNCLFFLIHSTVFHTIFQLIHSLRVNSCAKTRPAEHFHIVYKELYSRHSWTGVSKLCDFIVRDGWSIQIWNQDCGWGDKGYKSKTTALLLLQKLPSVTRSSVTDEIEALTLSQIYLTQQLEQVEGKAQSQWTFINFQNCGNSHLLSPAEAALLPETMRYVTTLKFK